MAVKRLRKTKKITETKQPIHSLLIHSVIQMYKNISFGFKNTLTAALYLYMNGGCILVYMCVCVKHTHTQTYVYFKVGGMVQGDEGFL